MSWLDRLLPARIRTQGGTKKNVPEGLWAKCQSCQGVLYRSELERHLEVCPQCGHHARISARRRLDAFLDPEPRTEIGTGLQPVDVLKFRDSKRYKDRITRAQRDTGEQDALIAIEGALHGAPLVAVAFEFGFMGGSMGSVVGERFARAAAVSLQRRAPLVCFSASGGARMQEGLLSLMQLAKTSDAISRLGAAGVPYISVLTDPTTGGVSASLAMLGDVIIAEPKALIGFAGRRVIEQTVRETLPEGFQSSEFLLDHGAIDMIVDRRELRATIGSILAMLQHRPSPAAEPPIAAEPPPEAMAEPAAAGFPADEAPAAEHPATPGERPATQ